MPIKTQIDALLQEKMDRKDFLKYAGSVLLAAIGVTGVVRMLLGNRALTGTISSDDVNKSSGYGKSRYGK